MKEEREPLSVGDLLFHINYQICKEFPALSPYDVDARTFIEVIDLFCDLRKLQIRQAAMNDPDRVIRRPAGDDWY